MDKLIFFLKNINIYLHSHVDFHLGKLNLRVLVRTVKVMQILKLYTAEVQICVSHPVIDCVLQVQIPADREAQIVSLILEHKANQCKQGVASRRLSTKKLTVSCCCAV